MGGLDDRATVIKRWLSKLNLSQDQLLWIAAAVLVAILLGSVLFDKPALPPLPDDAGDPDTIIETLDGRVLRILAEDTIHSGAETYTVQQVEVEITSGEMAGKAVLTESGSSLAANATPRVKRGMRVMIGHTVGPMGERFYIADFYRRPAVFWLIALFCGVTIAIGRWTGVRSLLGLIFSVFVLVEFILPRILAGQNPVGIGIVGAILLALPSLYMIYGFGRKTHAAALGMTASLLVTWGLAALWNHWAHLTGFGSDEGTFLTIATGGQIDLSGVILAGIVIGTLGVLDDIAVGQASATFQLRAANPGLSASELFRRGMAVGRDHIASMVNTLVLAYAGASLPLFLLLVLYQEPLPSALNREIFVAEIVRTLIGSIGLMLAVPLTSLIASRLAKKSPSPQTINHLSHRI
jgi:uncharacterized membrane protein